MTDAGARRQADMILHDCWNRIGVRGDRSCPDLQRHIHCRHCLAYAAGAAHVLDRGVADAYVADRTRHFAQPAAPRSLRSQSVVIFRIASEWLALPASAVTEIAPILPVHSLPHRRNGVALGLVNLRGELVVCVSLGYIVGLDPSAAGQSLRRVAYARLLAVRRDGVRAVCPVDEVHGIHRFDPRESRALPTTVARAGEVCSTAILSWQDRSVGVLDDRVVFQMIQRSLG